MRLLCVAVASGAISFGHLNRCLSIASAAAAAGGEARLFVFGDEAAEGRLRAAGHPYRLVPPADGPSVAAVPALIEAAGAADAVLADVIHSWFFEGAGQTGLFTALRPAAPMLAAIDAQGDRSLAARAPGVPVDVLVLPCAVSDAEQAQAARVGRRRLLGPDYTVLPPDFADLPSRRPRAAAGRVLVTCGGADPGGWTPRILAALDAVGESLHVRAVIGPLFAQAVRAETARLAARSRHRVEIVEAPDTLRGHMLWCDLAISASGLTKYELAASGTPALLFAIDAIQAESNPAFIAAGAAVDLGTCPPPERIARETERLLGDRAARADMAAAGQRLIDGRGAARLVGALAGFAARP